MLTHSDVQYLIGLLALVTNSGQINIGNMIQDIAAEKERDIDLTISYTDSNGRNQTLIGVEVKDEKRPLDVEKIEQLASKFNDMPTITERSVVSSSGYTQAAIRKAKYHNIDLLHFEPWPNPHQPNVFGMTFDPAIEATANIYHFMLPPDIYFFRVESNTSESVSVANEVLLVGTPNEKIIRVGDLRHILSKQAIDNFPGKDSMKPGDLMSIEHHFNLMDRPCIEMEGERIIWDRAVVKGQVTLTQKSTPISYWRLRREGSPEPFVACAIFNADEVFGNSIPVDLIGIAITHNNPPARLLHVPIDVRLKQKIRDIEAGYLANTAASLRQKPDNMPPAPAN